MTHKNNVDETISPTTAVWREFKNRRPFQYAIEYSRRYWRKAWKRNNGRKGKSLRDHRK